MNDLRTVGYIIEISWSGKHWRTEYIIFQGCGRYLIHENKKKALARIKELKKSGLKTRLIKWSKNN